MGQMKDSNMKTEAIEDSEKFIGEGSDSFYAHNYEETLAKYTKVENQMEKDNDKNTNLKSRAVVYINNCNYDNAVDDYTAAFEISQNYPKQEVSGFSSSGQG